MPCNCGKKKPKPGAQAETGARQEFSLTLNGKTKKYGSHLEAQVMNLRAGGAGIVKPVLR